MEVKGTPVVKEMQVIPVAGYDSMLMTLSGAHAPWFTRNLVILKDSAGNTGIGEIHGGDYTCEALRSCEPLVVGQPIGKTNYGIAGRPERMLLGRPVVCCDYVPSYTSGMTAATVFAFLFNFKDYVLNTNYTMTVKKYEDNDTDDQVTKAIMLVDGKVVDKNSLVTIAYAAPSSGGGGGGNG